MSWFLSKSLLSGRILSAVRNPNVHCTLSFRWLSSSSSSDRVSSNEHSFTVSYLMDSLGFSLETSKDISKRVSFKTRTRPDKVIDFLRKFGLSHTQIPKLVNSLPRVLAMETEKTILPKLEFLVSKGISRPELTRLLPHFPHFLQRSLHRRIIPTFEFLRTLLPSETEVVMALRHFPDLLSKEKYISLNVSTLRSNGVPDSIVAKFIVLWPRSFCITPVRFRETVEEVAEMGFNPTHLSFVVAVRAKTSKLKWENKVCHYKKWGWSEKDISKAFLKLPWCMIVSENKVAMAMDFFVSELGLKPTKLADRPKLLNFSLKKRLIPRVRVFQALVSKGLMDKKCALSSLMCPAEKVFLQRYVTPFADVVPELMKIYKDELQKSDVSKAKTIET